MSKKKDEVGYKKPPKKTQFKKGKSGNPKGRPKRSRNMTTLLIEALNSDITVQQNGKSRTMSKAEAIIARLMHNALTGDMRSMTTIFNVEANREEANSDDFVPTAQDKVNLERIKQKLLKTTKRDKRHDK